MEILYIILLIVVFIFGLNFIVSLAQLLATLVLTAIDFVYAGIRKIRGETPIQEAQEQNEKIEETVEK